MVCKPELKARCVCDVQALTLIREQHLEDISNGVASAAATRQTAPSDAETLPQPDGTQEGAGRSIEESTECRQEGSSKDEL